MKLLNKRTGEIGYTAVLQSKAIVVMDENAIQLGSYSSLAELNEEWKDMPEEPKERWYINENGGVMKYVPFDPDGEDLSYMKYQNEIGNYFKTKEEAELAVRKLKAWKRLKDKGFRFTGINDDEDSQELITQCGILCEADIYHLEKDADFLLIFGGEK